MEKEYETKAKNMTCIVLMVLFFFLMYHVYHVRDIDGVINSLMSSERKGNSGDSVVIN